MVGLSWKEAPRLALMTVKQVAEHLNVNPRTVLRLIERGDLKAIKVSSRWRVDPDDLRDYMERQATQEK